MVRETIYSGKTNFLFTLIEGASTAFTHFHLYPQTDAAFSFDVRIFSFQGLAMNIYASYWELVVNEGSI